MRRREDPRFLRGQGRYVDDLKLDGALHATFVRSPWTHARIAEIDTSAATAIAGVQVFTAADTDLGVSPAPPFIPIPPAMFRPIIASEKVRFAGDIVAVVLAPTREASVDAGELVEVDYEPLPHVTDIREAVTDEVLLFEEVGTNVCLTHPVEHPDPAMFDGCDAIVQGSFVSPRLAACPIEPRATAAVFADGRLTIWISTQTPHQDKLVLGLLLGLGEDGVRVLAPDVGGGFGGKALDVEDVIIGWLARATGIRCAGRRRAARTWSRCTTGAPSASTSRSAGAATARSQGLRIKILQDAGAYPGLGAFLPNRRR